MRVFVDASAWVPMQAQRDQHHARARSLIEEIRTRRPEFVTTNWTLYEALAVVHRWSHRAMQQLFEGATRQSSVVSVPPHVEAEALRRFLAWDDKTASVVDHANLLVALEARCDAILSFDEDFAPLARQAGVEILR